MSKKKSHKDQDASKVMPNKRGILWRIQSAWPKVKHEHLFLFIGLFFGLCLVFINPPWHSNDEDRHFINAYALSAGKITPDVFGDTVGHEMPEKLIEEIQSSQGISFEKGVKISWNEVAEKAGTPLDQGVKSHIESVNYTIMPITYLPSALMLKFGGMIKNQPLWLGWWARIGALMGYLLIVFVAIRIAPHYKTFLMVWGLTPMALYQGASVSYDGLSTALLGLLFALTIRHYFQDYKINLRQLLLFVLLAWLQSCCKQGYTPLLFSMICLPLVKFENKKAYWISLPVLLCLVIFTPMAWEHYLSGFHFPKTTFQNDFVYNADLSVRYLSKDLPRFFKILIDNFFAQGQDWIIGCVGKFGYSYTALPKPMVFIHVCALFLIAILENPGEQMSLKSRLGFLSLGMIALGMLIMGSLIFMSPIGATRIFGFQGRYLVPILPYLIPFLFLIPKIKYNPYLLRIPAACYCILVLALTLDFIHESFYI